MPSTIEKVHRERRGQPFAALAINIKESAPWVAGWVKSRSVTVPVLLDPNGAVTDAYRVTATPTVFLIGRDGRLVATAVGTRPWDSPRGRALLDALVSAPPR